MDANGPMPKRWRWLATLPVLICLLGMIVHWSARQLEGRMTKVGEAVWDRYALELKRDIPKPEPPSATGGGEDVDNDLLNELLGGGDAEGGDLIDDLLLERIGGAK